MKRTITLGLAVMLLSTGCYGPMNLTRKLHKWNGEVGGKWTNEFVFLGLALLHVYSFSALGDIVIFNTVEFWGGKNPVNAGTLRLEKDGDTVVAREASSGKLVGAASVEGELACVRDASGRVLGRVTGDQISEALGR